MKCPLRYLLIVVIAVATGCAHSPTVSDQTPESVMALACKPGRDIQTVKGAVWLKAKSEDASGQFPAMVDAAAPGTLQLEVTNLLGGTEALIQVKDRQYSIELPRESKSAKKSRGKKVESGKDTWGGIPLQWATDLFLGRVPCPDAQGIKDAKLSLTEKKELKIETVAGLTQEAQVFVYSFRTWGGLLWPEVLHWERKGSAPLQVDFKFDDPEDGTASPKKWEAKSSRGEVKLRWKERSVVRSQGQG